MSIQESISKCFSNYVGFQGRAPRSEYWWWALFVFIVYIVVIVLGMMLMSDSAVPLIIASLFMVGIILPSIAVSVRRLHDTDHSGWWFLIQLVPAIGGIWFLYFMVISGTPGPNRFGANVV
jgi:uncharacterized membrane protein YhaH (DUF805 family)